jgi:hypothetical protein
VQQQRGVPQVSETDGRENGIFFEFSLCLSRACLGKMIDFIYKLLKNAVFSQGPRFACIDQAFKAANGSFVNGAPHAETTRLAAQLD